MFFSNSCSKWTICIDVNAVRSLAFDPEERFDEHDKSDVGDVGDDGDDDDAGDLLEPINRFPIYKSQIKFQI